MSYIFHYVICIKWCCYLRHFIVSSVSFRTTICVILLNNFIAIYSSFEVSVPKASSNNSAKNGVVMKEIKIHRTALRFFLVAKKPTRT